MLVVQAEGHQQKSNLTMETYFLLLYYCFECTLNVTLTAKNSGVPSCTCMVS